MAGDIALEFLREIVKQENKAVVEDENKKMIADFNSRLDAKYEESIKNFEKKFTT